MGFLDILKKNKERTDVKTVTVNAQYNPYYMGYSNFIYPLNSSNKVSLRILGKIDLTHIDMPNNTALYECDIHYNDNYLDEELYGFDRLIIGLNIGRMVRDSEYTEFVFSRILDRNRIKRMHDVEFGLLDGKKYGNYVGSVFEMGDKLVELVDDNIGDIVEISSHSQSMHDLYRQHNFDINVEKRRRAEASYNNRQAKIDDLKNLVQELSSLENQKTMRK